MALWFLANFDSWHTILRIWFQSKKIADKRNIIHQTQEISLFYYEFIAVWIYPIMCIECLKKICLFVFLRKEDLIIDGIGFVVLFNHFKFSLIAICQWANSSNPFCFVFHFPIRIESLAKVRCVDGKNEDHTENAYYIIWLIENKNA